MTFEPASPLTFQFKGHTQYDRTQRGLRYLVCVCVWVWVWVGVGVGGCVGVWVWVCVGVCPV